MRDLLALGLIAAGVLLALRATQGITGASTAGPTVLGDTKVAPTIIDHFAGANGGPIRGMMQ